MDIVDGVYKHLFLFSNTKSVFLAREEGFEGDLASRMEDLTLEHPQMKLRKKFLTMWLAKQLTLTLAWINDTVTSIVMQMPREELSSKRKMRILRAFGKIVWFQQDLFQRHFVRSDEEARADLEKWRAREEEVKAKAKEEV
ncbi:hypothetical protein OF846_001364 [Rhodotorula toruloides]|nr:hypothetical protein OF846_001364 [Rhodotorula toruloides]